MTVIELIKAFKSTRQNVSTFNTLFRNSPLRYDYSKPVRIESRVAENIYNIRVGFDRIQHELLPCADSNKAKIGKINSGNKLLSAKELHINPTLFKIYIHIKYAHTNSFSLLTLHKDLKLAKHTCSRGLIKLQKLNIINKRIIHPSGMIITINPESKWNL